MTSYKSFFVLSKCNNQLSRLAAKSKLHKTTEPRYFTYSLVEANANIPFKEASLYIVTVANVWIAVWSVVVDSTTNSVKKLARDEFVTKTKTSKFAINDGESLMVPSPAGPGSLSNQIIG